MSGQTEIRWARVNDEPFEYAIQQGSHGDEFVKLLDGTCLRRAQTEPDIRAAAFEECARHLEKSYPGHAWLNAACAAIRTRAALSTAGDTGREAVPVAWQYRFHVAGWLPWHQLDVSLESFKQRHEFNLGNGTCELRPVYASPLPAARIGREDDLYRIRDIIASHIACEKDCQSMPNGCGCALTAARALTASAPAGGWQEVSEEMLEAGAQALANDVWHPPQPLRSLSSGDQNKFLRHALLVLKAALTARDAGSDVSRAERGGAA